MNRKKPLVIRLAGKERFKRLLAGQPQTAGFCSGLVNLKPGEEIGEHSTENKEEVLIILKGKAKIVCEKFPFKTVQKASLVYIPPQTTHNVTNIGKSFLTYIYLVAPV